MKRFFKKGVLLFAGAMAVCAVVLPSVAPAASWGVIGSHHTLNSAYFGFTSPASGGIDATCSSSSFLTATVVSASVLSVTFASFPNCTSIGPGIGHCTTTMRPTSLPWSATGPALGNVQIDRVHIDVRFEGPLCAAAGATTLLTGNVGGGAWNAGDHRIIFFNNEGLVTHPGNTAVTVRASFRDFQQTLTLS